MSGQHLAEAQQVTRQDAVDEATEGAAVHSLSYDTSDTQNRAGRLSTDHQPELQAHLLDGHAHTPSLEDSGPTNNACALVLTQITKET